VTDDEYDVKPFDRALSLVLLMGERTEWRDGVQRYVFSDTVIESVVRDEFDATMAGDAMAAARAGRARLLRAPQGKRSYRVGRQVGYRTAIR
jgi:hypothetical protein